MKKPVALLLVTFLAAPVLNAFSAWEQGTRFHIEQVFGKPCIVSPDGRPFKSVGMVWAYGPERGPHAGPLTSHRLIEQLELIKSLGFNTLNLYGHERIPEMLDWCDANELAVYFRTSFNDIPGLAADLRDYPDLMDPAFRAQAKEHYREFLTQVKGHPSVLAIDTDNRWLFSLDWSGHARFDRPVIRAHGVAYLPTWLEKKYGDIGKLNRAWGAEFGSFAAVTQDTRIVRNGAVEPLQQQPWRVDLFQYAVWTEADFLRDLATYLKSEGGGVMVTPTTEHPECVPDTNPGPDTGIDFMSPVHYNTKDDYVRDLPALCKLIYETRWHYDMQGGPTYVSETGWRTDTLEQKPPVKNYAWMEPTDEDTAARCYATQFALLDVLPWVSGYGYFMLYDKWPEGDFGYLRDDGSKKPQALVGDAINHAFDAAAIPDPAAQAWIYYPDYALATHRPGFQQIKSFVYLWEKPFLDALRARVDQYWVGLRAGNGEAGEAYADDVTADFKNLWRGFAFTRTIPNDGKPIVLLSTVSEILSARDRAVLLDRKTISFGDVGLCDSAMRRTPSWLFESLHLDPAAAEKETRTAFNAASGRALDERKKSWWSWLPWVGDEAVAWNWADHLAAPVVCDGLTVTLPGLYGKRIEFLAGSTGGNAVAYCEIEYADGKKQNCLLGPTISDTRFKPLMTEGVEIGGQHFSKIDVPLEPQRKLSKLSLPEAPWISLFGAAVVSGGSTSNTTVVLKTDAGPVEGFTPWLLDLGKDTSPRLKVLRTFANGSPAVVANGMHVAFLYDALNWAGRTDEISGNVDLHRAWVDGAVKYLEKP